MCEKEFSCAQRLARVGEGKARVCDGTGDCMMRCKNVGILARSAAVADRDLLKFMLFRAIKSRLLTGTINFALAVPISFGEFNASVHAV